MSLSDTERAGLWSKLMQDMSLRHDSPGDISKADLRAAVDAIDDWIEANQASFNASIPEPARSQLSAGQKAELFLAVVSRRWKVI